MAFLLGSRNLHSLSLAWVCILDLKKSLLWDYTDISARINFKVNLWALYRQWNSPCIFIFFCLPGFTKEMCCNDILLWCTYVAHFTSATYNSKIAFFVAFSAVCILSRTIMSLTFPLTCIFSLVLFVTEVMSSLRLFFFQSWVFLCVLLSLMSLSHFV